MSWKQCIDYHRFLSEKRKKKDPKKDPRSY